MTRHSNPQREREAWERYTSEEVHLAELQALVDEALARDPDRVVLEAGCGSSSWFRFPEACTIVGVDISQEQLERNPRLSRRILADIETCDLSAVQASAVICSFVLEHLNHPERAIANLARAVKPGGLVLLIAPNPFSLAGWITKLSPHGFHVWFYRRVLKDPRAGAPGRPPFPAPMRWAMSEGAVRSGATALGLEVAYARAWQDPLSWRASQGARPVRVTCRALSVMSRIVSGGSWDLMKGTYALALGRPQGIHASAVAPRPP